MIWDRNVYALLKDTPKETTAEGICKTCMNTERYTFMLLVLIYTFFYLHNHILNM